MSLTLKNHDSKKLFIIIFCLTFTVFLFTSDGHRYTLDEALGQEMAFRITTLVPDPLYVSGESKNFFNIPIMNPNNLGPLCTNGITCYPISIFYSITQVPFVAINHFFPIITSDTLIFNVDDFNDQHYVFWRNSEKTDLVFMELIYGPFFSALSVSIFFLICLEHKFTKQTSVVLSLLFSFSTILWAYSNTSLNVIPAMFFVLLGYLFYKKSQTHSEFKFLILASSCFSFSYLIRESSILFIIPIWLLILINVFRKQTKIYSFICFMILLFSGYFLSKLITNLRYVQSKDIDIILTSDVFSVSTPLIPTDFSFFTHVSGLLFSPGLGLFVFSPIILTIFFTFPDFFKKNKIECILFSSFFLVHLFYFSNIGISWHGLISWGPRYLFMIIPFLLIPLGTSLEKRNKKFMFTILIILGILGVFFNIAYVVQDVSWFVWGHPGGSSGLYGLGVPNPICDFNCQREESNFYINNLAIWTFQYSQLTQSILLMFQGLQQDIYMLHILGSFGYFTSLLSLISFFTYLLWKISRKKSDFDSIKS